MKIRENDAKIKKEKNIVCVCARAHPSLQSCVHVYLYSCRIYVTVCEQPKRHPNSTIHSFLPPPPGRHDSPPAALRPPPPLPSPPQRSETPLALFWLSDNGTVWGPLANYTCHVPFCGFHTIGVPLLPRQCSLNCIFSPFFFFSVTFEGGEYLLF